MLHTTNAKIAILSFTIFLILIGGVSMFKSIIHNKNVLENDLRNYIPADLTTVLEINQAIETVEFSSYISDIDSTILKIHTIFTYPIYLMKNQSKSGIIGKVTSEQEIVLKRELKKIFSVFPPKVMQYKGVEILFYQTNTDSFYCCTFFNGLFAGGYNLDLLQKIIDASSTKNFFNNEAMKNLSHKATKLYSGNLFILSSDSAYVCNILTNENSLEFNVYTNIKEKEYRHNINSSTTNIDYTIFPNSLMAFNITNDKPDIADTLSNLFQLPYYQFYTGADPIKRINLLKNIKDKFFAYNILNNLEFELTGKRLNTNDFVFDKQRIYTASPIVSKYIFKSNEIIYFSFFKEYLAYSKDKTALIYYLKNNGKFNVIENNILDEIILYQLSDYENYFFDKSLTLFPILKDLSSVIDQVNTYSVGYTFSNNKKLNMNLSLYKIKN